MYNTNPYKDQIINGEMHIWLQYCGFCPAKLATDFKIGDRIMYNTGVSYVVVDIREKSKSFLIFSVQDKSGNIYTQNVKKTSYKPYLKEKE